MFDGEIVEVFCTEWSGEGGTPHAGSRRLLLKLLHVRVCNPDKNGHRNIEFWGPNLGLYMFNNLDNEAMSRIQPLLDALTAAGVEFLSPR
jgi:hypothetical protein